MPCSDAYASGAPLPRGVYLPPGFHILMKHDPCLSHMTPSCVTASGCSPGTRKQTMLKATTTTTPQPCAARCTIALRFCFEIP